MSEWSNFWPTDKQTFHQIGLKDFYSFRRFDVSSFWNFVALTFCRFEVSSYRHFIISSFLRFVVLTLCRFNVSSFHRFDVLLIRHSYVLSLCRFANLISKIFSQNTFIDLIFQPIDLIRLIKNKNENIFYWEFKNKNTNTVNVSCKRIGSF